MSRLRSAELFKSEDPRAEDAGLTLPIYVSLCAWRAEAHAVTGDFDEAVASAGAALRMATEIKHPGSVAIASGWMGYVHVLRGQFDLAVPILERGSAVSHEHDLPHGIKANELYLALAYLFLGDHGRGADHLHRALEQRPGSFDLQWTRYGTITAAVHLAADQLGEARAAVTAGLQAASMRHAGAYMPTFLRLETEVRAADGANGARLERIEEALRLAAECGMRLEIAHCQLARGRLHAQDGRTQAATEAFSLAVQMYRQMGMRFWLEVAEGALKKIG